jgi:photosystem II stability/assembly factor-like uncharacterized protein
MKKAIKKFWGLGLIVIILSTLFVAAAPVSAANPLQWNSEAIPSAAGYVLLPDSSIYGMAIGPDGMTIYVTTGDNGVLYKSTNAGAMWSSVNNTAGMSPGTPGIESDLVAVAADDADVVVIGDWTNNHIRVSTTGGTQWSDLDTSAFAPHGDIVGLDVSSEVSGIRYVAVADDGGAVWVRKFGTSWEEWKEASSEYTGYVGNSSAMAVKFSPNFSSDRTLTAVTDNNTTGATYFELLVFTSVPKWNADAGLIDYPAHIYNYLGADFYVSNNEAAIALAPDYPGGGEYESVAFITIGTDDAAVPASSGVYRMDDYISSCIKRGIQASSVAFDGEVCVAGTEDARVWRSENPLDSSPSFLANNSMKGPSGERETLVGFAGTTVVAGTEGNESAFSVSIDNGRSFSDISLIDTSIDNISDFAVSPDGTKTYLVTNDIPIDSVGYDISLFRYDGTWQRVLSYPNADNTYIVRVSPDNFDVVYVAEAVGTKIFRSTAGGDIRWYTRNSGYDISDLAVESDNVLYVAIQSTATVSKSTNGGAYFGDGVNTKIGGNVETIKVLSEDNIIVSGTDGWVTYSTDGGDSWTPLGPPATGANAQVAATGLTDGSYVYASVGAAAYRWMIGQSPIEPWADISAAIALPTIPGMEMFGSTLYAATANTSGVGTGTFMRSTLPFAAENAGMFWSKPSGGLVDTIAGDITRTPTTMRLSSTETYVKVWFAATTALGEKLYSYMDTLVLTAPQNVSPEQGALIPLNVKSNYPYNITFLWSRPSMAKSYNLFIALDAFFSQTVIAKVGPDALPGTTQPTQAYTLTGTDLAKLTPGKTYYWAVSAATPISSGFSAMPGWEFTLQAGEASVPIIDSPAAGAKDVGTKPAFSWIPVTNTTKYQFQLSEGTAFAVPMVDETTMTTAIVPNVTLEAGKTYFWRVKALEPVESDWSAIGSFTVAVPAAPAPPPITVTQQAPPSITITQPAPPPAVTYQPPATEEIAPAYIWAIIIIGGVLVILVIVLVVRTRRSV